MKRQLAYHDEFLTILHERLHDNLPLYFYVLLGLMLCLTVNFDMYSLFQKNVDVIFFFSTPKENGANFHDEISTRKTLSVEFGWLDLSSLDGIVVENHPILPETNEV